MIGANPSFPKCVRKVTTPFWCAPLREVGEQTARRRLGLPLDKNVILIFAQKGYASYLPELPDEIKSKALPLAIGIRKLLHG